MNDTEKKAIEEMAHDLCGRCQDGICVVDGKPCNLDLDCTCQINATTLYNAGYRKQREARYFADPNYRTLGNCGECGEDVTCLNNYCPNCGRR